MAWHSYNSFRGGICFAHGCGVESICSVVCRTKAILAHCGCISHVGRALGNSRRVVMLPASHASFLGSVVCLSNCAQRLFLPTSVGTTSWNETLRRRHQTNSQFWAVIQCGCAGLGSNDYLAKFSCGVRCVKSDFLPSQIYSDVDRGRLNQK